MTGQVNLFHFADSVESRSSDWASVGITHEFRPPGESQHCPKPSASVKAKAPQAIGEFTVWVTGEAELEVIYVADAAQRAVHYELTNETLPSALDDFRQLLLNRPPDELLVHLE